MEQNQQRSSEELEFDTDLGGDSDSVEHENGVSDRVKKLEDNQAVLQLLADPDVRRVIETKQSGKPVKFAEESQETQEETPDNDPLEEVSAGLKDNDPLKKALGTISALIDKKLSSKLSGLDTLEQRIGAVEGVAGAVQKKEIVSQVAAARSKFKDFDQHKDAMLKLSADMPNLNVEELYVLSKLRKGTLKLNQPSTETEKPTHQPRREMTKKPNQPKRAAGRQGFSQMLQDALGKLELESE